MSDRETIECQRANYVDAFNREDIAAMMAVWRSGQIAIDGVVVHDVTGEIIRGEAEWDPPGGWRPFEVSLATGRLLKGKP